MTSKICFVPNWLQTFWACLLGHTNLVGGKKLKKLGCIRFVKPLNRQKFFFLGHCETIKASRLDLYILEGKCVFIDPYRGNFNCLFALKLQEF